jgi:hypothetical protein
MNNYIYSVFTKSYKVNLLLYINKNQKWQFRKNYFFFLKYFFFYFRKTPFLKVIE